MQELAEGGGCQVRRALCTEDPLLLLLPIHRHAGKDRTKPRGTHGNQENPGEIKQNTNKTPKNVESEGDPQPVCPPLTQERLALCSARLSKLSLRWLITESVVLLLFGFLLHFLLLTLLWGRGYMERYSHQQGTKFSGHYILVGHFSEGFLCIKNNIAINIP